MAPALPGGSQHKAHLVIGDILVQHACERLTREGTCSLLQCAWACALQSHCNMIVAPGIHAYAAVRFGCWCCWCQLSD